MNRKKQYLRVESAVSYSKVIKMPIKLGDLIIKWQQVFFLYAREVMVNFENIYSVNLKMAILAFIE